LEIAGAFGFKSLDGSNPNWVPIWGALCCNAMHWFWGLELNLCADDFVNGCGRQLGAFWDDLLRQFVCNICA